MTTAILALSVVAMIMAARVIAAHRRRSASGALRYVSVVIRKGA